MNNFGGHFPPVSRGIPGGREGGTEKFGRLSSPSHPPHRTGLSPALALAPAPRAVALTHFSSDMHNLRGRGGAWEPGDRAWGSCTQIPPGVSELGMPSALPEPTPHPADEAENQEWHGHTTVACPSLVTAVCHVQQVWSDR